VGSPCHKPGPQAAKCCAKDSPVPPAAEQAIWTGRGDNKECQWPFAPPSTCTSLRKDNFIQ